MDDGARLEFLDGRNKAINILGPRQPMVAVLDQCQHDVVAGKPGHQFDRVPPRHVRILHALQNMHRATGFYQSAEQ